MIKRFELNSSGIAVYTQHQRWTGANLIGLN